MHPPNNLGGERRGGEGTERTGGGRGRGREGTVHPPQCSLAVGATVQDTICTTVQGAILHSTV